MFPAPPTGDLNFATPQLEVDLEDLDRDLRTFRLLVSADRVGQAQFRADLMEAYDRRCAMTGVSDSPALQAAHISPYHRGPQTHKVQNGLLLRADLHTLFDMWLITVTDDFMIHVTPELVSQSYRNLNGRSLRPPHHQQDQPDAEVLRLHNDKAVWLERRSPQRAR